MAKDKERYEKEMKSYKPSAGFEPTVTKGKAKTKKDPNEPKRAQTAFFHFSNEMRPKIKDETPDISFVDTAKLIGEKWKVISADEKAQYEAMASNDKERHSRESKAYAAKKKVDDDGIDGVDDDVDGDDDDADSD